MSIISDRLKFQAKSFVAAQIGRYLAKQYARGKGPAGRVVSVFSDQARQIGLAEEILVPRIAVKKTAVDFILDGDVESRCRDYLREGSDVTWNAGVFSATDVDVSFPTGMHQVGGKIMYEMMPGSFLLTNPKYYFGLELMRIRRKRLLDEGVLLAAPWHQNYYHWTIEILPRLLSYDRCPRLQSVPLIVPKSAPRFVAESLRLAGYGARTLFLDDGVYRFKTLHMLSMLAPTPAVSADAVDWLNEKLADLPSTFRPPKRIYVSRRDAKIRFVSNEPELTGVLAEYGFTSLMMSGLSLADQIRAFRDADCIIGPHGAAFSNLAFATPGSIFIESYQRGHVSPCFNRIAGIRNLKYGFLVGEASGAGGFAINPRQLRAILSEALGPTSSQ